MILTDYSAVSIAAIVNSAMREKMSLDENVIKHITFSTFRNIHKALGDEFGRHVLVCDGRSWRKDVFEHYKANRGGKEGDTKIDWELIFRMMDEVKEAFDLHFPFDVVKSKNCEADDLIGAFCKNPKEKIVIVSKDKDFHQLIGPYVSQYNFSKKKFVNIPDPAEFRLEHIIRGDGGDGIPNVLSDDDTFVVQGKRQKMMTAKRLQECMEWARKDFEGAPADLKKNWDRNKLLIDLTNPVEEALETVDKYYTQERKVIAQNDTANYLAQNKMVVLMGRISDFYRGANKQKTESGPLSAFM